MGETPLLRGSPDPLPPAPSRKGGRKFAVPEICESRRAKAGVQGRHTHIAGTWIPAFAGMTGRVFSPLLGIKLAPIVLRRGRNDAPMRPNQWDLVYSALLYRRQSMRRKSRK